MWNGWRRAEDTACLSVKHREFIRAMIAHCSTHIICKLDEKRIFYPEQSGFKKLGFVF